MVFIPPISQLYVWRLAPFLKILCQFGVAIFLIRNLTEHITLGKHRNVLLLAFASGLLLILRWTIRNAGASIQAGAMLLLVCFYLVIWWRKRKHSANLPTAIHVFSLATLAILLGVALERSQTELGKSTLLHPQNDSLLVWAKTTPQDVVFLIPPEMGSFRLLGERAVVVDWKSTPILPKELIAWYQRVNAVSGQTVLGYNDAVDGYRKQNFSQLSEVATRFGATYIIIDNRKHGAKLERETPVFRNEAYSVYASGTVAPKVGF